jgi:hypothetical protein
MMLGVRRATNPSSDRRRLLIASVPAGDYITITGRCLSYSQSTMLISIKQKYGRYMGS